jgi:hypothetical protein
VGDRLLDVHVLARLAGPNGRQGVPVVGHGDQDAVDVLVVEHAAEVRFGLGRSASDQLDPLGEQVLVRIAERGESHVGRRLMVSNMVLALVADAENGRANLVVRSDASAAFVLRPAFAGEDGRRGHDRGARCGGCFEKLASMTFIRGHGSNLRWD